MCLSSSREYEESLISSAFIVFSGGWLHGQFSDFWTELTWLISNCLNKRSSREECRFNRNISGGYVTIVYKWQAGNWQLVEQVSLSYIKYKHMYDMYMCICTPPVTRHTIRLIALKHLRLIWYLPLVWVTELTCDELMNWVLASSSSELMFLCF